MAKNYVLYHFKTKIMNVLKVCFLAFVFIGLSACSNSEEYTDIIVDDDLSSVLNLPESPYNYAAIQLPGYFLTADLQMEDNTPPTNRITNHGATLGRVLFYDKKLSVNNTVSCASCHKQEAGFSDNVVVSVGFDGGTTGRNSMGLANAKYYRNGRYFWDERAATLEDQVLIPIQDHVEMGLTLEALVEKLAATPYYATLFTNAFGDTTVTSNRISLALAQFVRSMVSYQSKYDTGLSMVGNPGQNFPNFTDSENLGKNLFFSNRTRCADCHITQSFVGDRPRNNGLDAVLTDFGVGGVNGNPNNNGEFKVPSLRNIALTGPYMHDGRFETLEQVIEHYDRGVQDSPGLDNRLRVGNGQVRRLNLTPQESRALLDFLNTLTDPTFTSDPKYSNPFVN